MSDKTISMRVTRFRPEQEDEPTEQVYEIPYQEDWVVLDALNHIKDQMDGTLSYRWSCRMGVCGSCGMMVNGEPKLTCATFLKDYYPNEIVVQPLANFPIVRDLVVDVEDFMTKLKAVQPWIIREEEKPVSGASICSPRRSSRTTSSSASASTAYSATPPARSTGSRMYS